MNNVKVSSRENENCKSGRGKDFRRRRIMYKKNMEGKLKEKY